MTNWERHHPPHDHPDFDAYLDTLTDDDFAAMNATMIKPDTNTADTHPDQPEI